MKKTPMLILVAILLLIVLTSYVIATSKSSKTTIVYNKETTKENTVEKEPVSSLKVLFVGDIMTDRYIRKVIQSYPNTSSFVDSFLPGIASVNATYDYVVANLEGPITTEKSKSLKADGTYSKDLVFTFPTETLDILKALNIRVVSLANNHTDNFGRVGFDSTRKFLNASKIQHFGNPYNTTTDADSISSRVCDKGICIVYIGYHQFTADNQASIVLGEIQKQKQSPLTDFIVVMPHWGEEYQKTPNEFQQKLAHSFVDAGADLVIGAHPHVVQTHEVYKGKNIYYSVGNYIFDQWFSVDVQSGLGIEVDFTKTTNGTDTVRELSIFGTKDISISKEKIEYTE